MTKITKCLDHFSSQHLLKLLKQPSDHNCPSRDSIRNHLMGLLMLDAGLRVGELVRLLVSDLFFQDEPVKSLTVRAEISKTKVQRSIPLSQRLIESIHEMHSIDYDWMVNGPTIYAFFRKDSTKHLSTRMIQYIIGRASMEAFGSKINPHMLRHTFATRLMQKTNIRVVQQLLGHSSITSTQIYTHPNSQDLTQAIKSIET